MESAFICSLDLYEAVLTGKDPVTAISDAVIGAVVGFACYHVSSALISEMEHEVTLGFRSSSETTTPGGCI